MKLKYLFNEFLAGALVAYPLIIAKHGYIYWAVAFETIIFLIVWWAFNQADKIKASRLSSEVSE